jgi:integrase
LNALSNLYRRAQAEQKVPLGYNPVTCLMDKPSAQRAEARWLEVPEAALYLDAARRYVPPNEGRPTIRFAYPLVATFLLTGGREGEVLGLEGDVSIERKTVTFRPNQWRDLKTATSSRVVPLWPQLEAILLPYLFAENDPTALLFPSFWTGCEAMLTDIRKVLDGIAKVAGWPRGSVRSKIFRHTYCAARQQTLDRGAPVSEFTVARELGHGGTAMVRKVYGHLGQIRHRSEDVEYHVEQHLAPQRHSAPV